MPRRKLIEIKQLREFKFVDSMNSWFGSWSFLFIHILWFTFWLAMDLSINTLTMMVSLEAIILMILLLMSQNKQALKDDIRDEADLQADLQAVEISEQTLKSVEDLRRELKELKKQLK